MMSQTIHFTHLTCSECGIHYAVDKVQMDRKRKLSHADRDSGWWCPNGHRQVWKTSELDQLKTRFESVERERNLLKQNAAFLEDEIGHQKRKAAAYRGLLANERVEHIDVIEIDRGILDAVGPEFEGERVDLIHADALDFPIAGARWDVAWHDLWTEPDDQHVQNLHVQLLCRYARACGIQGAWKLPRFISRLRPDVAGLR